ncbi:MAG TPA: hypothetical protein VF927_06655 [Solirubrobacteraceae bacterium]
MRRAFMGCLAVLGLAALSLPALAVAVPTVTVKAKIVPIKGFPGTGNKLGAGAAVESQVTISGTEYGGFPPPLIGVNAFLPKGTVLHPSGFPACPPATLEPAGRGPKACPKGSSAGPVGKATGYVAFGTEVVPETATIEPFYAPGGGLEFFTFGHAPVLLEVLSKAHFVAASGLFSKELIAEVPLVETVPGAQDASVKTISVTVGSAIRKNGKTIYYGRVPKKCPTGGFPAKAELTFAGLGGLTQTTVTKTLKVPCPRR